MRPTPITLTLEDHAELDRPPVRLDGDAGVFRTSMALGAGPACSVV